MTISVFSVFMAVVWCTVFMVISSLLIKNDKFIISFGIAALSILLVTSIARLLTSFELPFTTVVRSEVIFPAIMNFLEFDLFSVGFFAVKVYHLLIVIWLIGAAVYIVPNIATYIRFTKRADREKASLSSEEQAVLNAILDEVAYQKPVQLLKSLAVSAPCAAGFINRRIYIPVFEMTPIELEYSIKHELGHLKNHDTLIRLLLVFFVGFFWWNPAAYFFQRSFHQAQEFRADDFVVNNSSETERVAYVRCLAQIQRKIQRLVNKPLPYLTSSAPSLLNQNQSKLLQRTLILLKNGEAQKSQRSARTVMLLGSILALYLASFLFILQPCIPMNDDSIVYDIEMTSGYAVRLDDGNYQVYLNDNSSYTCTEEHFNAYFSNIPVLEGN